MNDANFDTNELVDRACDGDNQAMGQLLNRHRVRLRKMVLARMDLRLTSRVDPSDIVQETLAYAAEHLLEYASGRPLPFYPWLRQIAWENLVKLSRQHIGAKKRSVLSEQDDYVAISDESAVNLASQFVAPGTSPSQRLVLQEMRQRIRFALSQLDSSDREVLLMRHVEQMRVADIAPLLGISESAVKMRRLRAVKRLRELIDENSQEWSHD